VGHALSIAPGPLPHTHHLRARGGDCLGDEVDNVVDNTIRTCQVDRVASSFVDLEAGVRNGTTDNLLVLADEGILVWLLATNCETRPPLEEPFRTARLIPTVSMKLTMSAAKSSRL
jgi:hypothetical protein